MKTVDPECSRVAEADKDPIHQVPAPLRKLTRWIRWTLKKNKQGKLTKKPHGSTKRPEDWLTFDDAVAAGPINANQGIGLVMTGGVDIETKSDVVRVYALDCDACRNPKTGILEPWVLAMIEHYRETAGGACVEVTPSGTGVRVWIAVRDFPKTLAKAKVKLDDPPAPNCGTKGVEIQAFGYGAAQFVTATGDYRLGDDKGIPLAKNLDYLVETFGMAESDSLGAEDSLPVGTGAVPPMAAIEAKLERSPLRALIFDAAWQEANTGKDPSASGAYWTVAREVLNAAEGHGAPALQFLATRTAWALGDVEESADPAKYARRSWIAAELCRADKKLAETASTEEVFGDDFDADTFEPPDVQPLHGTAPPPSLAAYRTVSVFELANRPPPRWLIPGYIPEARVGLIAAEGGTGKTGAIIDMCLRMVRGMPWLGRRVTQGSVVWFAGEGQDDLGPRCVAWARHHSVEQDSTGGHYFEAVDEPIDGLSSEAGHERLRATLLAAKDRHGHLPRFVVLDTMSTLWGGESENDTAEVAKWLGVLHQLAHELRCTILIVHHVAKLAQGSGRKKQHVEGARVREISLDSIRGASSLKDNTDYVLGMVATGGATVEVLNLKQRAATKTAPAALRIVEVELGKTEDGDRHTAMVVEPGTRISTADREQADEAKTEAAQQAAMARLATAAVALGGEWLSKTAIVTKAKGKRTELFGAFEVAAAPGVGLFETNGKSKERFRLTPKGNELAKADG